MNNRSRASKSVMRLASLAFLGLALAGANAAMAAQDVSIGAVYCAAEEIPFVGELLPPVVPIVEEPKVKAEIKLTPLQLTKLKESEEAFAAAMKKWLAEKGKGKGKADVEEIHGVGRMVEDARKRTGDVLKPHQLGRVKQLQLQSVGVLAVPKKNLQQLLRLEKEQERAIDEVRSELFRKIDGKAKVIATDGRCSLVSVPGREMKRLLAESDKAAMAVLSREQKEMVEKLKGKK